MKKFLLLILLQLFTLPALAAVFVVTSNADSGPGTLRQALTDAAANGNTEKDYINFNLPDLSEAGRTITITTLLPDISANLVIDGTTQPGVKFGVSDAKVKILISFFDRTSNYNSCFNIIHKSDISFYGLFLDRASAFLNTTFDNTSGIYGAGAKNIIIGAPGKGNIIRNSYQNLNFNLDGASSNQFENLSENIRVQSNFFGINEDGKTICTLKASQVIFNNVKDLLFGGETAVEGNVVFGTMEDSGNSGSLLLGSHVMSYNKIGIDYLGNDAFLGNPTDITSSLAEDSIYAYFQSCEVSNNVSLSGLTIITPCFFTLRGNKIGTDITGNKIIPHKSLGVVLGYCNGGGKIGGTNPQDKNIFAGCYQESYTAPNSTGVIFNISSPQVEVIGNVFKCNNGIQSLKLNGPINLVPVIVNRTTAAINGTAAAGSRVDLYYSIECSYCEPQQLFASVNTDAAGNWVYNGALLNYAIIAAATYNGLTSEFTGLKFLNQAADVKVGLACAGVHGFVKGLVVNNATSYNWYNEAGAIVGNAPDLTDAPPGKYHLIASDGYCNISSTVYEIKDASNQINDVNRIIKQSSCDNSDGSITGIQAASGSTFTWIDQNGVVKGLALNLTNVKAGKYTLTATTADRNCLQVYGPITITNTTGPNINQTNATITPSNCGESKGSITNISATGTGTLKYSWKNAQNAEVSTAKDLLNQPAGIYTLQVTDDTNCGPVYTSPITITELNGITIDESQKVITPSTCAGNNGSIKNIKVTGATSYKWYNSSGNVVSTQVDLTNVAAGNYYMIAANATCAKQTTTIAIDNHVNTNNYLYNETTAYTTCNLDNGVISLTFQSNSPQPVSYRLVNSAGQTISTALNTSGLKADTYKFYGADEYGCEKLIFTTNLNAVPALALTGTASVTADNCNIKTGSVQNVHVTGGHPPYVYSWTNSSGQIIAHTANIVNLPADNYTLSITDQTTCGLLTKTYTVNAQNDIIASPQVTDLQMCSAGDALLSVPNPSNQYIYRLYDSGSSLTPLDEQSDGKFKINVKANRSYYVSQSHGSCESSRAEVKVSVGITTVNIANTFSPNGDGINDTWKINGIENYPNAHVQIFTRSGEKVFESTGYAAAFNGTYNGKMLPVGTYYYIINLNSGCNLLSGNLTIVR